MSDNNLDLLINKPKEITLCGKKFLINDMSAGKALEVVEKYQNANKILINAVSKNKDIEKALSKTNVMKRYQNKIIDVCLEIIKPKFSFKSFKVWKQYVFLTRRWLYENATVKQLESFIKIVLHPILGDEAVKKMQAVEEMLKKSASTALSV